jgi:hypothetical protein
VKRHSKIKTTRGGGGENGDGRRMFYDENVMERTGTQNMAFRKSYLGIKGGKL